MNFKPLQCSSINLFSNSINMKAVCYSDILKKKVVIGEYFNYLMYIFLYSVEA